MSEVAKDVSNVPAELVAFHQFIGEQLRQGNIDILPEEALEIWRAEHPLSEDFEESVEALREALDDLAAGDVGIPAEQFFREFREAHGLPPRPCDPK